MGTREPWERWRSVWQHALFCAGLGLTTIGALLDVDHSPAAVGLVSGLATLLAAWYAYWFVLRRDSEPAHLPYLIGAAVLWAVAAAMDPAMLLMGVAVLVPYALRHAWWSAAAVLVVGTAWMSQRFATDGRLRPAAVLFCALGILAVMAVIGYIGALDREARKRKLLLDELREAQAELAATERLAGILTERQRLAREIHDTLTQVFASIAMLLDAARADLADGPGAERVTQAMHTARQSLAESRRLIQALRPVELDSVQLADAVRRLTQRLTDETGVSARTVVTGRQVDIPPDVEVELLRIVQEALSNVRRHARATAVTATITYLEDVIVVDIQDDGSGFDTTRRTAGIGLHAMTERADELGGSLTVESELGEGTTVAVSVPVGTTEEGPMAVSADGRPGDVVEAR